MTHKITKFQKKVWETLKDSINTENSQWVVTFDDDLTIEYDTEGGTISIIIFPTDEIHLSIKYKNGTNFKEFFDITNLNNLIKLIKNNDDN